MSQDQCWLLTRKVCIHYSLIPDQYPSDMFMSSSFIRTVCLQLLLQLRYVKVYRSAAVSAMYDHYIIYRFLCISAGLWVCIWFH